MAEQNDPEKYYYINVLLYYMKEYYYINMLIA